MTQTLLLRWLALFFSLHGIPLVDFAANERLPLCLGLLLNGTVLYGLYALDPYYIGGASMNHKSFIKTVLLGMMLRLNLHFNQPCTFFAILLYLYVYGRSIVHCFGGRVFARTRSALSHRKPYGKVVFLFATVLGINWTMFGLSTFGLFRSHIEHEGFEYLDLVSILIVYLVYMQFSFVHGLVLHLQVNMFLSLKEIEEDFCRVRRWDGTLEIRKALNKLAALARTNETLLSVLSFPLSCCLLNNLIDQTTSISVLLVANQFLSGLFFGILLNALIMILLVYLNQRVLHQLVSIRQLFLTEASLNSGKSFVRQLTHRIRIQNLYIPRNDQLIAVPSASQLVRAYEMFIYGIAFQLRLFHLIVLDYSFLLSAQIFTVGFVFFIVQTTVY